MVTILVIKLVGDRFRQTMVFDYFGILICSHQQANYKVIFTINVGLLTSMLLLLILLLLLHQIVTTTSAKNMF